jgi:hypothetical protein
MFKIVDSWTDYKLGICDIEGNACTLSLEYKLMFMHQCLSKTRILSLKMEVC